jgi:hypothetical protein
MQDEAKRMIAGTRTGPLAALLFASLATQALAAEAGKYPDWSGQWERIGGGSFDPNKRPGRGQQPPLTPAYQAIWEANMAEEATGGQSYNTQVRCLPGGMPRMMTAYQPMEVIVTAEATYIPIAFFHEFRRIYTDGRDWPAQITPTFSGYSIGRWTGADGSFEALEVETRGLKGPRILDPSGIPVANDNQTIVRERFALDSAKPDILHDVITTFDHALTRPWTVDKTYRRVREPTWIEDNCAENNMYVFVGKESFFRGADGNLMPTRKDQPPPELRGFSPSSR